MVGPLQLLVWPPYIWLGGLHTVGGMSSNSWWLRLYTAAGGGAAAAGGGLIDAGGGDKCSIQLVV